MLKRAKHEVLIFGKDRTTVIGRELPNLRVAGGVQSEVGNVIGLIAKLDEQPAQCGRQLRVDHESHGAAAGRMAWSA